MKNMWLSVKSPRPRPTLSVLNRVEQFPHFPREGIDEANGTSTHAQANRNIVLFFGIGCADRIQRGVEVSRANDPESFCCPR